MVFKARPFIYILFFVAGLLVAFFGMEMLSKRDLLVTTGQSIGLGIAAVAICCFALQKSNANLSFFAVHGSNYAKLIYLLCEPVAFALIVPAQLFKSAELFVIANAFSGVLIFVICLLLSIIIGYIKYPIIASL